MLQSHVQLRHAMKMHMMVSKKEKEKNDLAPAGRIPLPSASRPFARSHPFSSIITVDLPHAPL
jgi:hypothetical protein